MWPALGEIARFVMFKDAFDKVINTKNLLAIEKADAIRKTDTYRVYPVKQEILLEEGWEKPEDEENVGADLRVCPDKKGEHTGSPLRLLKDKFLTGKYEGNKWGGKYLRAPDIFFTILERGKGSLYGLGILQR